MFFNRTVIIILSVSFIFYDFRVVSSETLQKQPIPCYEVKKNSTWKQGPPPGWFFNNLCVDREEEKKEESKNKESSQSNQVSVFRRDFTTLQDLKSYLDTLDGKQLKEFIDQALNEVVKNPEDTELTRLYLFTQHYAIDKGVRFAQTAERVYLENPELNPVNRSLYSAALTSSYSEQKIRTLMEENYQKLAQELSATSGIYLFVSASCPLCKIQAPIIEGLYNTYGLKYVTISNDSCEGYKHCIVNADKFEEYNIRATPAVVAVFIINDQVIKQPVAYGVTSGSIIIDRIYRLYNYYKGYDVFRGISIEKTTPETSAAEKYK